MKARQGARGAQLRAHTDVPHPEQNFAIGSSGVPQPEQKRLGGAAAAVGSTRVPQPAQKRAPSASAAWHFTQVRDC
jgi:hypothetical protein